MPDNTELPQPGDSAEEIIDKLNKLGRTTEGRKKANEYLAGDIMSLDADVFSEVYQYFTTTGGTSGRVIPPQDGEVYDRFQTGGGVGSATSTADPLDTMAEERLANQLQGAEISQDLDGDGRVDASELKAFEDAKVKLAKQQAEENGTDEQSVKDQIDFATDTGGLEPIPAVLLQAMGRSIQTGYDAGLEARIKELISNWNEFNPDRPIADRSGLFAVLNNPNDPDVQQAIDATFLGTDPDITYNIKLSDGTVVTIDANQFAAFDSVYGSAGNDRGRLANIVRSAARSGIQSATGMPAWQITAALTRAKGLSMNPLFVADDKGTDRSWWDFSATPSDDGDGSGGGWWGWTDALRPKPAEGLTVVVSGAEAVVSGAEAARLNTKFKEGQWIYHGNDTLAYIHALNPTLATKIAGDPAKLTQNDWRTFNQYLIDGGFDQNSLAKMGYYALGLDEWNQMSDGGGFGAGGSGATRMKPDPEAVKQAARDLYRQLFAAEPSESQLNSIVSTINSTVSGAATDQSIDVSAQIRKGIEADPQYKELYGKMPAGMTPEEYQAQYRAGAATLLGNEAPDPNAIRSGLRSGNYQTTLGRVAGGKQAWNNSSFLGRLAQAAQVVSENT